MPLKIEKLTPHVAFAVTYQGKIIPIFHHYEDDMFHKVIEGWYTADKNEGIRDYQSKQRGIMGDQGFTLEVERDDWYFSTHRIFEKVKFLPEFQDEDKRHAFQWDDSFILQVAIDYGLVGFDDDYRWVDTTLIEEPMGSCTGGVIYPYEVKEVSNG